MRIDNADERLTPIGAEFGLATAERCEFHAKKRTQIGQLLDALENTPQAALLRRTEGRIDEILPWIEEKLGGAAERGVLMTVETEMKYAGYIDQQRRQIERMQNSDTRAIPRDMGFV